MATRIFEKIHGLIQTKLRPKSAETGPERKHTPDSLQKALHRLLGVEDDSQTKFRRIYDALVIAAELKNVRKIEFEDLLSSDPLTGIETLALLGRRESNPNKRATEDDIIAMILSDYLRVIERLPQTIAEQKEIIKAYFNNIFNATTTPADIYFAVRELTSFAWFTPSKTALRALRGTPRIDKIKNLTNTLIRVGAVNLLERVCMRSLTSRNAHADKKERYTAFDHMVMGIVNEHPSTILIRGAQKLIQARNKFNRQGLRKEDKNRLISELNGIYIPLAEAYHYNALAKSLKDLVFEAQDPEEYKKYKNLALEAAKACVPECHRKHITDLIAAEGIVADFLEEEIRKRIPEAYRDSCVVEVRLKNLSDVRNKVSDKKRLHARDFIGARIIVKADKSDNADPTLALALENDAVYAVYRALHKDTRPPDSKLKQFTYECADNLARTGHPLAAWFCRIKDEDRFKENRKGEKISRANFFDDYILKPRETGYQALHDTWFFFDETMEVPGVFELQVVGHEMRIRNESGSGNHATYASDRRGGISLSQMRAKNNVSFFVCEPDTYENEIVTLPNGNAIIHLLAKEPEIFFSVKRVEVDRLPDSLTPLKITNTWADLLAHGDRITLHRDNSDLANAEARQRRLDEWEERIPPELLAQLVQYHSNLSASPPAAGRHAPAAAISPL